MPRRTRIAVGSIASPAGPACTVEIQYFELAGARLELALAGAREVLQHVRLAHGTADRDHDLPVGVGGGPDLGHRRHVLLGESGGIAGQGERVLRLEHRDLESGLVLIGRQRFGQLEAEVVGSARDQHAVVAERADRAAFAQRLGVARPAETQVERPFDGAAAGSGPRHLGPAIGGEPVEARSEVGGELATPQRSAALRLDDAHRRRGVDQPGAVLPEAQVGEVAARSLEGNAAAFADLDPPGELLEIGELAVHRLAFDELHGSIWSAGRETFSGALSERRHRERRLPGGQLAAESQEAHCAAVEEEVDPAVHFAGFAGGLACAGHPVEHLESGAPGARHGDRVAPEVGDLELGDLAAGRRHDRRGAARIAAELAGWRRVAPRRLSAERDRTEQQSIAARERPRTTRST